MINNDRYVYRLWILACVRHLSRGLGEFAEKFIEVFRDSEWFQLSSSDVETFNLK